MNPAHPLPSDPRFLAVLDGIEVSTRRPSLVIAAMPVESLSATASKFSGVPYLPRDGQVPLDDEGEQMALLAQFRLADYPPTTSCPQPASCSSGSTVGISGPRRTFGTGRSTSPTIRRSMSR